MSLSSAAVKASVSLESELSKYESTVPYWAHLQIVSATTTMTNRNSGSMSSLSTEGTNRGQKGTRGPNQLQSLLRVLSYRKRVPSSASSGSLTKR